MTNMVNRRQFPFGVTGHQSSIRIVLSIVRAKSEPNAAAGLIAPCGDLARVCSTARMLAAAVNAYDSPVCSQAWAVAPPRLVARAHPNDRVASGAAASSDAEAGSGAGCAA